MLIPVSPDYGCAISRDRVIHATPVRPLLARKQTRRTVDAVCGRKRLGLAVAPTDQGLMVMIWPPYARQDEGSRCIECWAETGKPKPNYLWRRAAQ